MPSYSKETGKRRLTAYIQDFRPELFPRSHQALPISHVGHETNVDMPKPVRSKALVRHPYSLCLSTGLARKPNAFPVKYSFHGFFSATTYGPNSMKTFTRYSTHLWNPTDEEHCSLQPTSTAFSLFVVLPVQGRKAVFSQ